ncbi:MAG TPA: hypothetical protein VIQ00_14275 [Chitinophagaceae bacterium]
MAQYLKVKGQIALLKKQLNNLLMKKTAIFVAIAMFLGILTVGAQQTDSTMTAKNTVAATTSLTSKFLPMPEPLTMEKIFPAIGTYHSTTQATAVDGAVTQPAAEATAPTGDVMITLDPTNKGIVWIEGLPQGKVKAMLRVSPATYKIPAQKTEEGKDIPEGTLIYDKDANVLNICLGCKYNDVEPAQAFATTADADMDATAKTTKKASTKKAKVWTYTGAKAETVAPENTMNPANDQQKQDDQQQNDQ